MFGRKRPVSDEEPRGWRAALVVLLVAWCVVAMDEFRRAMQGPAGLIVHRPAGTEGAVGMPLNGAMLVTTVRALLEDARDSRPWLVILPGETHPFVLTYVRYQLAHIAYPQRVDVGTADELGRLDDYGSIVAPSGLGPSLGWRVVERRGDLLRFERSGP